MIVITVKKNNSGKVVVTTDKSGVGKAIINLLNKFKALTNV